VFAATACGYISPGWGLSIASCDTRLSPLWPGVSTAAGLIDVRAVPAILAASEGGSPQVASWLVPLWLLCVVFIATTAWEAYRHIQHYEGSRHWVMVSCGAVVGVLRL
jgi:hypothetical protein